MERSLLLERRRKFEPDDGRRNGARMPNDKGEQGRLRGMEEPIIVTLGCRLNAFEAEVIRGNATAAGLSDCVVVNTCAVTTESVRQAQQTIRRLRRDRPTARLVVTGCAAQLEPERFTAMPEVDAVIGNADKLARETFLEIRRANGRFAHVSDIMAALETSLPAPEQAPPGEALSGRSRAHVAVQTGCDHRCTFCIIPFARGPSRSVPAGDVVAHVRSLVAAGYREVVLTGVDLTSYGKDLPGPMSLGRLAAAILDRVPRLPRLRLSSIDPAETDAVLIDLLAVEPRLMPHLHLSLQSGDDLVLKRMRRRHTRTDAIRLADRVRTARPDMVLGADLIVGFPTETEAMFDRTLDAVEACGLTHLHVFPYSARTGTPAARMPQVAHSVVRSRAARLRTLGAERLSRLLDQEIGNTAEVLMERGGKGRTPGFLEVALSSVAPGSAGPGKIVNVRITGHDGARMTGEVIG